MNVLIKNQSQYIFKTKNLDKNVKNDNISLLRRGLSDSLSDKKSSEGRGK